MILNIPRVHMRAAVSFMQGSKYARGGQLPFELFDAIAMSDEEAGYLQTDCNIQRAIKAQE